MILIDLLLIVLLMWISFKIATIRDLFSICVYFIVFGMILSLIWIRLGAYDLAIAEVALGSGIVGALLLDTLTFLNNYRAEDEK
ncbi:MAG: Na(+)/H(+) antiporter subunit B [Campylobacterales bacterium]